MGFIPDIAGIMEQFHIDSFINSFILEPDVPCSNQWKLFINTVVQNLYYQKWRVTLSSNKSLRRYADVHVLAGVHPLVSLITKFPKYSHKLIQLTELSFIYEQYDSLCRLCNKQSSDPVLHFLVECPKLYMSRDKLFDKIVNILQVSDYLKFSNLDDDLKCNVLLGDNDILSLRYEDWENFIIHILDDIQLMMSDMNEFLSSE